MPGSRRLPRSGGAWLGWRVRYGHYTTFTDGAPGARAWCPAGVRSRRCALDDQGHARTLGGPDGRGHPIGQGQVGQMLRQLQCSFQWHRKTEEGVGYSDAGCAVSPHQFCVRKVLAAKRPVILIDSNKNVLLGTSPVQRADGARRSAPRASTSTTSASRRCPGRIRAASATCGATRGSSTYMPVPFN
jgi:hypothetical protein